MTRIPKDPSFCLVDLIDGVEFSTGGALRNKAQLFESIAMSFDRRHGVGAEMLEAALREREKKQSTALGRGVGLPHVTLPGLTRSYVDLWILDEGVEFMDAAKTVVDVCFAVFAPPGERRDHLRILARIGHLVLRPEFLIGLRRANTEEEVRAIIAEQEEML